MTRFCQELTSQAYETGIHGFASMKLFKNIFILKNLSMVNTMNITPDRRTNKDTTIGIHGLPDIFEDNQRVGIWPIVYNVP